MRIVIDTNVWVSGLLWRGPAWTLLRLAEAGRIELCATPPMLSELAEVLNYERLQPRLAQLGLSVSDMLAYVMERVAIFEVRAPGTEAIVAADPDDDIFLHCAAAVHATYVVSADTHLTVLGQHGGIPILTVRDFLAREFPEQPLC